MSTSSNIHSFLQWNCGKTLSGVKGDEFCQTLDIREIDIALLQECWRPKFPGNAFVWYRMGNAGILVRKNSFADVGKIDALSFDDNRASIVTVQVQPKGNAEPLTVMSVYRKHPPNRSIKHNEEFIQVFADLLTCIHGDFIWDS